MNTPTLVALAGAVTGLGAFLLVRQWVPGAPDLGRALERLTTAPTAPPVPRVGEGLVDRVGLRAQRQLGSRSLALARTTRTDLALLDAPVHSILGRKVLGAAAGFLTVPVMTALVLASGGPVGGLLPAVSALALAALGWVWPTLSVRRKAAQARREYSGAISAYLDLVAIARVSGDAASEAMARAAAIANNPAFRRIAQSIQHAAWAGQPPWDALSQLRDGLAVPELGDVADIMRLTSGGGQVTEALQQKARALRDAQLATEHAAAARESERLSIAMTLTCVVLAALAFYTATAALLQ